MEYRSWKAWCKRDNERIEAEKEKKALATKKHNSWSLFRECASLINENKNKWKERQEAEEESRKIEDEKSARLVEAEKKKFLKKAAVQKKETKQETTRRLEDKKKLEGRSRMRSELWRQRR